MVVLAASPALVLPVPATACNALTSFVICGIWQTCVCVAAALDLVLGYTALLLKGLQ